MPENVLEAQNSENINDGSEDIEIPSQQSHEGESDQEKLDSKDDSDIDASIEDLPLPGEGEPESEKKKELPKWAEKRISKKERELQQKEAEAAMYKAELERIKSVAPNVPSNGFDPEAPRREDFETEDEYIDARFDYREKKKEEKRNAEHRQQSILEAEMNFRKRMKDTLDQGSEKYEDFEEKAEVLFRPDFPPNRAMAEAIVDSEHKSDILYFLGMYPNKAKEIALMNPIQAVKKIAELESRFKASKKPNITKTPKPIEPVRSNKGEVPEGDPNKMNQVDFEKWYKSKYGK